MKRFYPAGAPDALKNPNATLRSAGIFVYLLFAGLRGRYKVAVRDQGNLIHIPPPKYVLHKLRGTRPSAAAPDKTCGGRYQLIKRLTIRHVLVRRHRRAGAVLSILSAASDSQTTQDILHQLKLAACRARISSRHDPGLPALR